MSSFQPKRRRPARSAHEVLALTVKPAEVKPVPPAANEAAGSLAEPELPKHRRRFKALSEAGPAKVAKRFERVKQKSRPPADGATLAMSPDGGKERKAESEISPFAPQLQMPSSVVAALAKAEEAAVAAAADNPPSAPKGIADKINRKAKERRGVPPPLKKRPARSSVLYDW